MNLLSGIVGGAAAGAAGTTALNATTYLDMTGRGRGTSSAPEDTVERLAEMTDTTIPGDEETRPNRVQGLGALQGIVTGVGIGAALGALRAGGWRPPALSAGILTGLTVMAITDGTMAAVGVSDPRKWRAIDWASDVVPHLAYGLVTAATLARMD